jgi:hypothetical protein
MIFFYRNSNNKNISFIEIIKTYISFIEIIKIYISFIEIYMYSFQLKKNI